MDFNCNIMRNNTNCGKVGLDLDGVIIDHTKNKIKTAKAFGFNIKAKETPSEILKKILPSNQYQKLQRRIYGRLTLEAKPVRGTLKTIKKISRNYNLFIISRRNNPKTAVAWLKKYKISDIIPSRSIFFVKEDRDKNKLAKKLKIDVFLDDKAEVLKYLSSVPRRVFFNPHKTQKDNKFAEINSWKEFPAILKKLKRGF